METVHRDVGRRSIGRTSTRDMVLERCLDTRRHIYGGGVWFEGRSACQEVRAAPTRFYRVGL